MLGIQGIDKVIYSEIPGCCTIMVNGDTGTLKTTMVFECLKIMLDSDPEKVCIYFSLKDEMDLLIKRFNLQNYIDQERLILRDYEFLADQIPPKLLVENAFKGISEIIGEFCKKFNNRLSLIVLDPLNILMNHVSNEELRRHIYHFFSYLGDLRTQNWIVYEKIEDDMEIEAALPYHFLSDGILELGTVETQDDVIRYFEIKKLRGVNHSLKRFQLSYKKNELRILGPTYEV